MESERRLRSQESDRERKRTGENGEEKEKDLVRDR